MVDLLHAANGWANRVLIYMSKIEFDVIWIMRCLNYDMLVLCMRYNVFELVFQLWGVYKLWKKLVMTCLCYGTFQFHVFSYESCVICKL